MNFIPELPSFLVLLQNIEKGDNLLVDSSELFWIFCDGLMSRESYLESMAYWKNKDPEGWSDADIKATMLRGFDDPDAIAQESLDKFDAISRAKRLALQSSETSDSISLYITTHIEAARLNRLIKVDGYSDEARITLENSLSFFSSESGQPSQPIQR